MRDCLVWISERKLDSVSERREEIAKSGEKSIISDYSKEELE